MDNFQKLLDETPSELQMIIQDLVIVNDMTYTQAVQNKNRWIEDMYSNDIR